MPQSFIKNIKINENEQIANVIIVIKKQLEQNNDYSVEKHQELVTKELIERQISDDVIELWVNSIE